MSEDLIAILEEWDRVDSAARSVSCALPRQMSEAIANLENAQQQMRDLLRQLTLQGIKKDPA